MKQETLSPSVSTPAEAAAPATSRLLDALRVIARNRLALLGLCIVSAALFTALFAPFLASHDPYEINIVGRLQAPSAGHWLGTDFLGRDTYSRIVFGARTAFGIAAGAVLLGALLGVPLGAVAGFSGRWIDSVI